jgi:hypothetical protein
MRIFSAAAAALPLLWRLLAWLEHIMHASWVGQRSNQYSQSDDDSWED